MKARRIITYVLPLVVVVAFLAMTASIALAGPLLPVYVSLNGKTVGQVPTSLVATFSTPTSTVDTNGIKLWVALIAKNVDHKVMDYTSTVDPKKKKSLVFKFNVGFSLDQPAAVAAVSAQLSKLTTDTLSQPAVTIKLTGVKMRAPKKLGKQILVVQSKTTIYLYDNTKVIKTYRCAVGQKAWPTPNGVFHIGKKVKMPTWTNGDASWSKGMPAYVGPGPNNPLGTRALYVYSGKSGGSDIGVRFHGVPPSENSSIGHAASHGCLRMHRKDVENFYPRIPVGTLVTIVK